MRVSLAAVGRWIRSLGQLQSAVAFGEGAPLPPRTIPHDPEIFKASALLAQKTGDNNLPERVKAISTIRHAAGLSETPVREEGSPLSLDADLAKWLPQD